MKAQLKEKWKSNIEKQWETTIMETQKMHKDPNIFWKKVKMLMENNLNKIKYIKKEDGSKGFEPEEQEEEFRRKWKPIYRISDEKIDSLAKKKKLKLLNF